MRSASLAACLTASLAEDASACSFACIASATATCASSFACIASAFSITPSSMESFNSLRVTLSERTNCLDWRSVIGTPPKFSVNDSPPVCPFLGSIRMPPFSPIKLSFTNPSHILAFLYFLMNLMMVGFFRSLREIVFVRGLPVVESTKPSRLSTRPIVFDTSTVTAFAAVSLKVGFSVWKMLGSR